MCALSEALAPTEDGEIRVISSREGAAYFVVLDSKRRGRCAGGMRDEQGEWRFFHGRYAGAPEDLDGLEEVEILALTPSVLEAFEVLYGVGVTADGRVS